MSKRKYTLPRHTVLAKNGSRTGAFLVDFAVTLALMFAFVFLVFLPIFKGKINEDKALIAKEQLNSGLYIKGEDDAPTRISGKAEYTEFVASLEYFYLHYLPGNDIKEGLEPCVDKKDYDVSWFNLNILEIDKEGSSYEYFEYQKAGENPDLTKIGVKKEGVTNDLVNTFIQSKYKLALVEDFNAVSNVQKAGNDYMQKSTLCYVLALLVSGAITYILIPWLMKNGQTLGKKVFKLGLANSNGYKLDNKRLLMRFVPFAVVDVALYFLVPLNLYIVLTIVMIIFLVSFTLAMSSPKRMSLHDLTAQTIVVDLMSSVLFNTVEEEEKYVLKEDNLFDDINEETAGEEPELKYEK